MICEQHRITADKREIKNFPKLPSATSFICKTLGEMQKLTFKKVKFIKLKMLLI